MLIVYFLVRGGSGHHRNANAVNGHGLPIIRIALEIHTEDQQGVILAPCVLWTLQQQNYCRRMRSSQVGNQHSLGVSSRILIIVTHNLSIIDYIIDSFAQSLSCLKKLLPLLATIPLNMDIQDRSFEKLGLKKQNIGSPELIAYTRNIEQASSSNPIWLLIHGYPQTSYM